MSKDFTVIGLYVLRLFFRENHVVLWGELRATYDIPLLRVMKKALQTAITISAFLISLIAIAFLPHQIRAESGESIGLDSGATLFSPANTTYNSGFLTLNLTLGAGLGVQYSLNYSIDGKYGGPVPLVAKNPAEMHIINMMDGSVELPELFEGSHYLTVYELSGIYGYHGANPLGPPFKPASPGSADYVASWTHTVYFTINSPSKPSPSPSPTPAPSAAPSLSLSSTASPSLYPRTSPAGVQEHFIINNTLYAFQGSELLCSFNVTAGCWVELNLTATGDNSFETIFEVASSDHGLVFNSTIYGSVGTSDLVQTVNFNYDDSYNITVAKHPFYSTVTIRGTIDVFSRELLTSPSPTVTPTLSPSSSPSPSDSPTQQPTIGPTQTASPPSIIEHVPNYPLILSLILVLVVTAAVAMIALFYFRKRNSKSSTTCNKPSWR